MIGHRNWKQPSKKGRHSMYDYMAAMRQDIEEYIKENKKAP